MILKRYNNNTFSSLRATLFRAVGVKHYNIAHGTRLQGLWEVSFGIDDKIMEPELGEDKSDVEMLRDDYILLPIVRKGTGAIVRDKTNNKKYFLSSSASASADKALLFLTLSQNADSVSYELSGECATVSVGIDPSFSKGNDDGKIAAPVVLMEDGATITITNFINNKRSVETITFSEEKFTLSIE